ncbi:MAG: hypothetical protein GF399_12860 [Candidatus Coatesbacteria bacterium]|nr:hypothetical protein [Candidatus Coatesbacteria bacterium]
MTSMDSSRQCRLYLAALLARGFSIRELARGLHVGRRLLKRVWFSLDYLPQTAGINSELGGFIAAHPGLPTPRELSEEGLALERRMGSAVWGDPDQRDAWIAANSA